MAKPKKQMADYIVPININGLKGRMLNVPPPPKKKREILIVYGMHSSIERWFGMAEDLCRYGAITMPDLPGLGGMDSFYKIGEKPSLDNMADYLAAFIKLRYKRKRVTIVGMSFGFIVVTRMLQKYPELTKKVDMLVSLVGFAHHDDFVYSKRLKFFIRNGARLFSTRPASWFARNAALRGPAIRRAYRLVSNRNAKMVDASPEEFDKRVNFEIGLWQSNDIRTYMDNIVTMFTLDICHYQVDLEVIHVYIKDDKFFNNSFVEQHLGIIYDKVQMHPISMNGHAPTVIAESKDFAPFIPTKIRRMLTKSPKP